MMINSNEFDMIPRLMIYAFSLDFIKKYNSCVSARNARRRQKLLPAVDQHAGESFAFHSIPEYRSPFPDVTGALVCHGELPPHETENASAEHDERDH